LFEPGFDESYEEGYFEDVDLCLRVREQGYSVRYEPGCTLIHTVGSTRGTSKLKRNAERFRQKWRARIQPDVYRIHEAFW
jgi:GT2 family glycosyltransferase